MTTRFRWWEALLPTRCNLFPWLLAAWWTREIRTEHLADRRSPAEPTATFPLSSGDCNIPANATGYSVNVTLVPIRPHPIGYLTIWPTGELQPPVSTMNSLDGRVKANAAIVPAGAAGSVSVYRQPIRPTWSRRQRLFHRPAGQTLQFYPLTPCRVLDTRNPNGTWADHSSTGGQERDFPGVVQ